MGETSKSAELDGLVQLSSEHHQNSCGIDLAVCLPFQNEPLSDSGVRLLLCEDSLKDVDGFIEARKSPLLVDLEAQKLLDDQQDLGVNFEREEELPVEKMVNMEVRDRGELSKCQESMGFQ
ncbi:hypothetical protein A2U01_0048703 [Trifolium medium]|uniref:Uncharacterized protein n=1 Tax=Trifolium medium TaxID=97028 RepID=A0A392QUI6_9FABA|nr:hypothetical protein [Trifolium medium]